MTEEADGRVPHDGDLGSLTETPCDLGALIEQLREVHSELDKDCVQTSLECMQKGSHIQRRAMVRALFSHVEAVTWQLKQIAHCVLASTGDDVSLAELAALTEVGFQVVQGGRVKARSQHVPLLSNVQLAFKSFVRATELQWSPDYSGEQWEAFRTAVSIRNRVTHPKGMADITISDSDLGAVFGGQAWWRNTLNQLFFHFDQAKQP